MASHAVTVTDPIIDITDPIIARDFRSVFTPKHIPPMSTWSEENIVLSPEYSARSSQLILMPWQREIWDAWSDPRVEELTIMSAVQITKTLAVQCAMAWTICNDPGPILLVEPKEDSANAFSKRRLTPMMRDCACLHGRLSDTVLGKKTNTLLAKDFPGGNLLIVSARTPTDLAQHTIRYLICDEPDKYPVSVKSGSGEEEGDPMDLAWKRALTFGSRRKRMQVCSPTTAGRSRIGKAYQDSDMRKPYVPCPFCGYYQVLSWEHVVNEDGRSFTTSGGSRARYRCSESSCRAIWTEGQRWKAIGSVEWRATNPFAGAAGFWVSHLYAPPQWIRLSDIARDFLKVHRDPPRLRVFITTVLAQEWEDKGETPDHERLYARREPYPFNDEAVVPQRALFLTAFADVQESPPRLEVGVTGWGRDRENWPLAYYVIKEWVKDADGNDTTDMLPVTHHLLWERLDAILQRNWRHESGRTIPIMALGIDTGRRPKPVYEFARRHAQLSYGPAGAHVHAIRTVVPTKGTDDSLRIIAGYSKEDAVRKRQGVRIISIGTHCAKQELYDLLQHVKPGPPDGTLSGPAVPGCYHFPMYELSYFIGLTAEYRIVHENGRVTYEKRAGVERNEPLDIAVGNRAMAAIVGIDRFSEAQWRELEKRVAPMTGTRGEPVSNDLSQPTTPTTQTVTSRVSQPAQPSQPSAPAPARPYRQPTRDLRQRPIRGRFVF